MKKCQHNTNKCPGHYETNLCGGPNPRKCCVEGSSPDCGLVVYENTHIKGYNGLTVQVDEDFVQYMDDINDIAKGLGLFPERTILTVTVRAGSRLPNPLKCL